MPDEALKPEEPEKPQVTAMVVTGKHGEKKEILKGADGKFVRKERKMIPTRDVTAEIRKFLNQTVEFIQSNAEGSLDGHMTRKQKSRLNIMLQSVFEIAAGTTKIDAKSRQAAVMAFEALMLRGHGKPALNDEEQDALKRAGIRTVFVAIPKEVLESEVGELPEKPKQPSFANDKDLPILDAEIVEDKK